MDGDGVSENGLGCEGDAADDCHVGDVPAIVQDDARLHGTEIPVPSEAAKGPLALIRPANPEATQTSSNIWMSIGASVGLAAFGVYWLAMWLITK